MSSTSENPDARFRHNVCRHGVSDIPATLSGGRGYALPAATEGYNRLIKQVQRIQKHAQFSALDTIPLDQQTAGRKPDITLIARSKSKRRYQPLAGAWARYHE